MITDATAQIIQPNYTRPLKGIMIILDVRQMWPGTKSHIGFGQVISMRRILIFKFGMAGYNVKRMN